jgi:hypothetical protein
MSAAGENSTKGFNGFGSGLSNIMNTLKAPLSQAASQRSGGGSVVTSLSDLEKIERIMNEAQHADKSIVKYFGGYFEEFRRDMHYYKEIVFTEMLTHNLEENKTQ